MKSRRKLLSTIFEKKPVLIINTLLHTLCLLCSLIFNNHLGNNKFNQAPFNFFWEWLTVFWCVWSSILMIIYNLIELRGDHIKGKITKKRWEMISLILAVGNLLSVVIFTTYLPKQLSENIRRGPFWWIYSLTWHYIAFPLSLFYFCKFVQAEEKIVYQKKTFLLLAFQPFIFFIANFFRAASAERVYLTKRGWKKFMVPQFEWAEKGELLKFFLFFWSGILFLWLLLLLLIKIKKCVKARERKKETNYKKLR